jgi:hypothetical protein
MSQFQRRYKCESGSAGLTFTIHLAKHSLSHILAACQIKIPQIIQCTAHVGM